MVKDTVDEIKVFLKKNLCSGSMLDFRAGEPEPVVFGCSEPEPEPAEKKTRAGAEAAQKKTGSRSH